MEDKNTKYIFYTMILIFLALVVLVGFMAVNIFVQTKLMRESNQLKKVSNATDEDFLQFQKQLQFKQITQ